MQIIRRKKSVAFTKEEKKAFQAYLSTFHTHTDAAEDLGLSHPNMIRRAVLAGSASPETVAKIRSKINV